MAELFSDRLVKSLDQAKHAHIHKSWRKALIDLNDLAMVFNAKITAFTRDKLGTTMIPHEAAQDEKQTHNIYMFSLVGDSRKEVIMAMGVFAVQKDGAYPILMLDDQGRAVKSLEDREQLEDQFVWFMHCPYSQFMQAILKEKA